MRQLGREGHTQREGRRYIVTEGLEVLQVSYAAFFLEFVVQHCFIINSLLTPVEVLTSFLPSYVLVYLAIDIYLQRERVIAYSFLNHNECSFELIHLILKIQLIQLISVQFKTQNCDDKQYFPPTSLFENEQKKSLDRCHLPVEQFDTKISKCTE